METKIVETPIEKHKVELKSYFNALDYRKINTAGYSSSDAKIEMEDIEAMKRSGKLQMKIGDAFKIDSGEEDEKIRVAVISIDDKKEDILDRILKFRKPDFNFVLEEIAKIMDADKKKLKNPQDITEEIN